MPGRAVGEHLDVVQPGHGVRDQERPQRRQVDEVGGHPAIKPQPAATRCSWTGVRLPAYARPVTELQGSLLDLADEVVVRPLRGVRRTPLAHGAWVDVMTGLRRRRRPAVSPPCGTTCRGGPSAARCTTRSSTSRGCCASTATHDPLPHPALATPATPCRRTTPTSSASRSPPPGLCLYRDGHDSVAWHGDRIGRSRDQDTMVRDPLGRAPRATSCSARAAAGRRSGCRPATATSSSWAARASAPGTTASPRRASPWARGSRCSSAPHGVR